ncbi:MAG: SDR family oxidoreductase [Pirellulales bacterium]
MGKYLVTGGAGFIGSHIAEALLKRGDSVRVLDNFSTGYRHNLAALPGNLELIEGDITDPVAVKQAVKGVEVVFHQAALASVPRSIERPLDTHAACVTGTLIVLDEARRAGVRRVVYAASSSAYGDQPYSSKREKDLPAPLSPYAAAKLAGEYYCQAFWHSYGLETVGIRYFNVFGPRQDPNSAYAAVIPCFISRILSGNRPLVYGDGGQTRDFTYVANVVHGNLLAADAPGVCGRVLNVANGRSTSLLELLNKIGQLLGSEIQPEFAPGRTGDVRDSLADITEARRLLSYGPVVDFDEGLRRTVEFYQQALAAV